MKEILVIQGQVPHYRRAFFNQLAERYRVTVAHSGTAVTTSQDSFFEYSAAVRNAGPMRWQQGIQSAVRDERFEAVVLMFDLRWINSMLSIIRPGRARLCLWGHRYGSSRAANRVRNILMRRADAMIQYSECEIPRMLASGIPEKKIYVAPNTLSIANHQDGSRCAKDCFLFVGRAQPRKRVDLLIRAFAKSIPDIPTHITLKIVGDGRENIALKQLANELGVADRVEFMGKILDAKALRDVFHRAYAYVSPGPVGLGVLHSFAYGVPVVTFQEGHHGPEFSNIQNGINGIIYSHPEDLSPVLTQFPLRIDESQELGGNAYKHFINNRSMKQMVEGFSQAIENHNEPVETH